MSILSALGNDEPLSIGSKDRMNFEYSKSTLETQYLNDTL